MKRLFRLALVIACLSCPAFAAWSQNNACNLFVGGSLLTSASCPAFSSNLVNPSVIIVTCRFNGFSAASVTDTAGNIYADSGAGIVQAISPGIGSGYLQTFVTYNTHTTASNIPTCAFPASNNVGIDATEVTIAGLSSLHVDSFTVQTQTASPVCGANSLVFPTYTTAGDGDLIYAVALTDVGITGLSAGTTPISFTLTATPSADVAEYGVQTTHGALAPTEGCSGGSGNWGGISIALGASSATHRHRAQVMQSQ